MSQQMFPNVKVKILPVALVLVLLFLVYRNWFLGTEIIGGDWPYYFPEMVSAVTFPPPRFVFWQNNGLGGIDPAYGLHVFESLLAVVGSQWLGLPWPVVYKIGWFGLFLLLSFLSPAVLYRTVIRRDSSVWEPALAGLIYSTNTYILMVAGGGQMGVALAYSLAPLVISRFLTPIDEMRLTDENPKSQISNSKQIQKSKFKISNLILSGLLLGLQVMIDPRIAYVTIMGVVAYYIVEKRNISLLSSALLTFSVSVIIAGLLNAFWLLPILLQRTNPLAQLGPAHMSAESLKFFSFADFSHTISLLHPNWPENIFGKTYFLQPEFLILPILAFGSLIFISNIKYQIVKKQRTTIQQFSNLTILYFAFLGLLGAFLAKGVNPPFGEVYRWFFVNIPGFALFRDPTKFYLLISLGYSILIPYTLSRFRVWFFFLILWLILIRQAALGQLGGTFVVHTVPEEYHRLKDILYSQQEFFRTLWVPKQSRFVFVSPLHPAVEAQPLFSASTAAELTQAFSDDTTPKLLKDLRIRYVIIPSDPLGEIFVSDRAYDQAKHQSFEDALDRTPWLKRFPLAGLSIYEIVDDKIQ